ncbi:hypothetical protein [Neptuniibacter sp. QD37_11]|uniref:hypothetical protein n=1 Tax=Neptuniibacter sp. QD37_11 TaxID=3398209 RepID=UPI0039F64362
MSNIPAFQFVVQYGKALEGELATTESMGISEAYNLQMELIHKGYHRVYVVQDEG